MNEKDSPKRAILLTAAAWSIGAALVGCSVGGEDNVHVYGAGGDLTGSSGTAGAGGQFAPSGCLEDSDCVAELPQTDPPGCAAAECDSLFGTCRFVAGDGDGDGHLDKNCVAIGGGVIEGGDDCDDSDGQRYPGNWDGPAGDGHPDNGCGDFVDNDCNGVVDDAKLSTGASCICAPGQTTSCDEYPNGAPIQWPTGAPIPPCQSGTKPCGSDGQWGACLGAVLPDAEVCDYKDNDCDGNVDEQLFWMGIAPGQSCSQGIGACKATATVDCVVGGGIDCTAVPTSPQDWHTFAAPNGWDWNCDGSVEVEYPVDVVVASCDFGFTDPCKKFISDGACTGDRVLGCAGLCGQSIVTVTCAWVNAPGGGHTCSKTKPSTLLTQGCK